MHKPDNFDFDILIAGGGAAGLTAAIGAGMELSKHHRNEKRGQSFRIGLIEKKEIPGKKLSATGNGRCNLSNAACEDRTEVDVFFHHLGILTRTDEAGRMYPYSEEAGEVSALLTETARAYHTEIMTNCQVLAVEQCSENCGGFVVSIGQEPGKVKEKLRCRLVMLAMGGKSYSVFGTTGDGYGISRKLGHKVTRLAPSLVPVTVEEDLKSLAGVRTKALVRLEHLGTCIYEELGEVQINKDAVSGICVMNLSRLLKLNPEASSFAEAFREYEITLDLVPELSLEELESLLERKESAQGMEGALSTLVKKKLAYAVLAEREDWTVKELASHLKEYRFHVTGTKGWNDAQVTRGGVELTEVNPDTMESNLVEGLYFSGEIMDFDGPCGGYNLHYAWLSGLRGGRAMAQKLLEK